MPLQCVRAMLRDRANTSGANGLALTCHLLYAHCPLFAGLGWMMLRDLWDNELKDKWSAKLCRSDGPLPPPPPPLFYFIYTL